MHRLLAGSLVLLSGLVGCAEATSVDSIPGARVAKMAEQQLEATHTELATGTMTCPDLDFTLDASVECERIAELSEGRRIRIAGTVSVTSTRGGGKLHVKLDDDVDGFGISAHYLEDDLRTRAQKVLGVMPDDVWCPDLEGEPGTEGRCTVDIHGRKLTASVTVVRLVPSQYRTIYRFGAGVFDPGLNPGLPSLLREIRRGGVTP